MNEEGKMVGASKTLEKGSRGEVYTKHIGQKSMKSILSKRGRKNELATNRFTREKNLKGVGVRENIIIKGK